MRTVITLFGILFFSLFSFRPPVDLIIQGTVLDETGKPLANVSVQVKGSRTGTSTDAYGKFSISVPSDKAVLIFSYPGYISREVKIRKDGSLLSITMKPQSNRLDEVVVTGYGTRKKKDQTGAVANISTDQLYSPNSQPLQGKSPGLVIRGYSTLSRGLVQKQNGNPGANWRYNNRFNREGYDNIDENKFLSVTDNPLSTFSIDVDAASYSNIRRMISQGQLPPAGAVRIEEMINYFKYEYPQPEGSDPFSINTEMASCPWNNKHRLVLIGLQGKNIPQESLPPANLVFLIDVSGSMMDENKLPLVRQSMKLLADQLRPEDQVSIVVYAGNAGLVLPPTPGSQKMKIKDAIDRLEAGGSTAGGAGIQLAYKVAKEHFNREGNNRVILCTDGDFNVGESSDDALERMIEKERESGVFLTVLGFGMGNYQDAKMQKLADKGNGNHAYIDNFLEARKVLISEFGGTLFTIAKDVKLQIEFNPARVQGYRLIGYENRVLAKEDFNNDKKDAGDLGSGHTVTALYEIIPSGEKSEFLGSVDKLKYQSQNSGGKPVDKGELMTVKFRYKQPQGSKSTLIEKPVKDDVTKLAGTSNNFRFAAAVAEFGMLLRNSEFRQASNYNQAWDLAKSALGNDPEGYRGEFLRLVRTAQSLALNNRQEEDDGQSE